MQSWYAKGAKTHIASQKKVPCNKFRLSSRPKICLVLSRFFSELVETQMAYTDALASKADASILENASSGSSSLERDRSINVSYILFGFGALWVLAIAAALAVPAVSLLNCQTTILGDVAVREPLPASRGVRLSLTCPPFGFPSIFEHMRF